MPENYTNRLKACKKLESAETKLIKTAYKLKTKAEKAAQKKNGTPLENKWSKSPSDLEGNVTLAETLVPQKKRPTHRLKPFKWLPFGLPFMGKKVDTIEWCREEIVRTDGELKTAKEQLRKDIAAPGTGENEAYPPLNCTCICYLFDMTYVLTVLSNCSCFCPFQSTFVPSRCWLGSRTVAFAYLPCFSSCLTEIGAHMAVQSVTHNQPYTMNGRYIETAPDDVIWSNLSLNPFVALPSYDILCMRQVLTRSGCLFDGGLDTRHLFDNTSVMR